MFLTLRAMLQSPRRSPIWMHVSPVRSGGPPFSAMWVLADPIRGLGLTPGFAALYTVNGQIWPQMLTLPDHLLPPQAVLPPYVLPHICSPFLVPSPPRLFSLLLSSLTDAQVLTLPDSSQAVLPPLVLPYRCGLGSTPCRRQMSWNSHQICHALGL